MITERTWASVIEVKENGVMLDSGTGVLRMARKSGSVRGRCRIVTDEKWALKEVVIK